MPLAHTLYPAFSADELDVQEAQAQALWSPAALQGCLVELSYGGARSACLTWAAHLVTEAQRQGDYVAWLLGGSRMPYPPDLVSHGLDLAALAWVRCVDNIQVARSAERLLHSGAYGLVVLDLGDAGNLPDALAGRLVKLAQMYEATALFLTAKSDDAPSISSIVGLRVVADYGPVDADRGVSSTLRALKDKRHGPQWQQLLQCRLPVGWS